MGAKDDYRCRVECWELKEKMFADMPLYLDGQAHSYTSAMDRVMSSIDGSASSKTCLRSWLNVQCLGQCDPRQSQDRTR